MFKVVVISSLPAVKLVCFQSEQSNDKFNGSSTDIRPSSDGRKEQIRVQDSSHAR
jgi:hypothetical protein